MLGWIESNLGTLIISIILLAIITSIVIHLIRQKKQGKHSCGGNCSACSMNCGCHREKL